MRDGMCRSISIGYWLDQLKSDDRVPDNETLAQQNLDQPSLPEPCFDNFDSWDFSFEENCTSKLDREWGFVFDTLPGNNNAVGNHGTAGGCSSGDCFSVGSEVLSRTSFDVGIAYPHEEWQIKDKSIPNIEVLQSPNKNVENSITHLSSCNTDETPSQSENEDVQSDSIINSKGEFETYEIDFQVPALGMEFSSEEDAYRYYKNYATQIGFRVRKGKIRRLQDGTIRKRYFFCSKQGFRSNNQSSKRRKYNRKETRTGCDAMIQVTHDIDLGKWVISAIDLEHNHEIEGSNQRHVTSPSANISEEDSRISGTGMMMMKEAGVANSAGFSFVDSSNYLCIDKINILPPAEGQSLVNFLKHLQLEDPSFSYTVQLDSQSRVINFFWRDGRSKIDYEYFGDVLILDTTFRIEKYDIICAPFLGLNHHQQYVLFGCGFLLDDSMDSFVWLFRTFLEAMGNRQPKTIFTDECQATSDAIEVTLPESQHRLGLWYIFKNARKHLSQLYRQPGFEDLFDKCICHCNSEEQFFSMWESLLEKYNLRENTWLNTLFLNREKWSHVFSKITFSAGIEWSQECENVTSIFCNTANETVALSKFVQQYLEVAEQWRKEELYEHFHCNEDKQAMILRNSSLEKQALEAYTCRVFKLFQEELRGCLSLAIEEIANDGRIIAFKLTEEGHENKIVEFNCLETQVTCSCKKFETIGILCVHALKVLNAKNVFHIPSQYILKRWTKSAKHGMVVDDHKQEITRLKHKALYVVNKSVAVERSRRIVEKYLDMALKEVECVSETEMTKHVYGNVAEPRKRIIKA